MSNPFSPARRALVLSAVALVVAGGTALSLSAGAKAPQAPLDPANPVTVELFTSQGCSSCPPADDLAARLAHVPGVLVLSRPVTYWDRLGWKDTLAREANTTLQRAYARRGFDGNGVYTPQIVVDGRYGAVGSEERTVRSLLARAAAGAKPRLTLDKGAHGAAVTVAGGKATAELALLTLQPSATISIGSGENGGRKVTYTNVVRDERALGTWTGGTRSFDLPGFASRGNERHAVVLRQPGGGAIYAARLID